MTDLIFNVTHRSNMESVKQPSQLPTEPFLFNKALEPLTAEHIAQLEEIAGLDVVDFTEADVREEIISPILVLLGYRKGSTFSVGRELPLHYHDRRRRVDYSLLLWSAQFWVIEAKKPQRPNALTNLKIIQQGFEYASHPQVNAALVALCDGREFVVYDRETQGKAPILQLKICNLLAQFDELRRLLAPWQIWFFEKRRILRQIDKVFDREINLGRVAEFKSAVLRQLDDKRDIVIDNMRSSVSSKEHLENNYKAIRSASIAEIVDGHFFVRQTTGASRAAIETLVDHSIPGSFKALYQIFPDYPRDMNDHFCGHALAHLMTLEAKGHQPEWLPEWLGKDISSAVRHYIQLGLTHFATIPTARNILLTANAMRRLAKIITIIAEPVWQLGEANLALSRYFAPEDSWSQQVSSAGSENLHIIDRSSVGAVARLVRECADENGKPRVQLIERRLREMWTMEATLLERFPNYMGLMNERNMGEIHATEHIDISYDFLGHSFLCEIDQFPQWNEYTMLNHHDEVKALSRFGSWKAAELLGKALSDKLEPASEQETADRFFLGDTSMLRRLRSGYQQHA